VVRVGSVYDKYDRAPNAASNTKAIAQTAFDTRKPPRKLLAVPAFAALGAATNTQTLKQSWRPNTRFQSQPPKILTLPCGR
jgi:hypothetical protein